PDQVRAVRGDRTEAVERLVAGEDRRGERGGRARLGPQPAAFLRLVVGDRDVVEREDALVGLELDAPALGALFAADGRVGDGPGPDARVEAAALVLGLVARDRAVRDRDRDTFVRVDAAAGVAGAVLGERHAQQRRRACGSALERAAVVVDRLVLRDHDVGQ